MNKRLENKLNNIKNPVLKKYVVKRLNEIVPLHKNAYTLRKYMSFYGQKENVYTKFWSYVSNIIDYKYDYTLFYEEDCMKILKEEKLLNTNYYLK